MPRGNAQSQPPANHATSELDCRPCQSQMEQKCRMRLRCIKGNVKRNDSDKLDYEKRKQCSSSLAQHALHRHNTPYTGTGRVLVHNPQSSKYCQQTSFIATLRMGAGHALFHSPGMWAYPTARLMRPTTIPATPASNTPHQSVAAVHMRGGATTCGAMAGRRGCWGCWEEVPRIVRKLSAPPMHVRPI